MNNKPTQLETLRKEHYNKLFTRQPQLTERLIPLMEKADIIQESTEPSSTQNQLKSFLIKSEPIKIDKKRELVKKLNKFSHKKKSMVNVSNIKKISEIRPDILMGLQ